jgi:hypothetical protein
MVKPIIVHQNKFYINIKKYGGKFMSLMLNKDEIKKLKRKLNKNEIKMLQEALILSYEQEPEARKMTKTKYKEIIINLIRLNKDFLYFFYIDTYIK